MSSEIHRVLKPKPRRKSSLSSFGVKRGQIFLLLSAVALIAASSLTAIAPGNLKSASTEPDIDPDFLASILLDHEKPVAASVTAGGIGLDPTRSGTSGANIRRTQFADGSEVNIYSPKDRDGSGAVLLNGKRFGQDQALAARPNDDLLEEGPYGPLPKIGSDGLRPMEQYARPWSGARGVRIAIVVGGIGLSQTGSQKAIATLPAEVTLGFAASGNSLQRWMQEARRKGHELLLQMPMQAFGEGGGEGKLLANVEASANIDLLQRSMAKITNYTGVMNYLGGQFLADEQAIAPVMDEIAGRGLLFLDDGTSAQSKVADIGEQKSYPVAFGDMVIDNELSETAILRRLDDLERQARRNGSAIGTASAFDETIFAVTKWVNEAQARGIEIVGVASLISDRQ